MELLVGVFHDEKYAERCKEAIDTRIPNGLESLMVETPSNLNSIKQNQHDIYQFLYEKGFFRQLRFFDYLEATYSQGNTKVIYGGLPLNLQPYFPANKPPKLRRLALSTIWNFFLDMLITHETDKFMLKTIEEQNPQVVVLGRRHADYIKRRFPNVYYIAFALNSDIASRIGTRIVGDPKLPNKIITLDS